MTKRITPDALDAAYAYVADRADLLVLCNGAPGAACDAMIEVSRGGRMLCAVPLSAGLGHGDFEVGPGSGSGRRMVIPGREAQVCEMGIADHLAVVSGCHQELLIVTVLSVPHLLEAGTTVLIEAFAHEFADPK